MIMNIRDIQTGILDSSKDIIIAYDNAFNTVYINPYACEMLELSEETTGLNPEKIFGGESAAQTRRLLETALADGSADGDAVLITKSGKRLDVSQKCFAIVDADGSRQGIGIICVTFRNAI